MPFVTLNDKAQVTIPSEVRKALGLNEGDLLDIRVEGGSIVLTPQRVVDPKGQRIDKVDIKAAIQEGLDAYHAGDMTPAFDSVEDLFEHLDES
jgi:antitoxin PrlF